MSDLTNIWTKSNCLSQTQLLQYLQQKLEREEVYLVESHINDCPMCNDALEGLMHSDLEKSKEHLSEIKSDFEKKLSEIKPIEKPKAGSASTSQPKPIKSPSSTTTLQSSKGSKFRWAYAASVLLIVGLGYSVFSFIKDYTKKSNLAHTKENPKITSAETPYTPVNDSSGELIHIEASPEDIGDLSSRPIEDKKTETKIVLPQVTTTKELKPSTPKFEDARNQKDIASSSQGKEVAVENPPTKTMDAPSYTSESVDNYSKEEVESKKEVKKQISSQKSPGYGMSKNNAAPQTQNNAANQLNYSSNSNLQKEGVDNLTSTNVKEKSKYDNGDEKAVKYQEALSQYNKGHYKKSIKQLEKLLPSSKGEQREDLLYYLAMSHLKQDNIEEANSYFSQLRTTAKYGKIVAPYLSEIKHAAPAKKK